MLFRKYHFMVFKGDDGACKNYYVRRITLLVLLGLVLTLLGSNVYLWNSFVKYTSLKTRLNTSEKTVEEQKNQLLSLANKLKSVEKDLTRVRDFDSKLRVMMSLDQEQNDNVSLGGPKQSFSDSYLPIYRQELLAKKMHNFVRQLNTDIRLEEVQQQQLIQAFRTNEELLASTPSIWPTEGWVSSPFGYRKSPFTGRREFHRGIDISSRRGTPIVAPAKGRVVFTGVDNGYGKSIVVDHGNGITTRYAHLSKWLVKRGETIERGQQIAHVGNTGRSTGPHLHYEVRLNGLCVNPKRYILN